MNSCHKYQDLMLTVQIDGEIKVGPQKDLEQHLESCAHCRQFKTELLKNVIEPFGQIKRKEAPAQVWGNIQARIEQQARAQEVVLPSLWERLKELIQIPQLVPMLASFAAMAIVAGVVLSNYQFKVQHDKAQGKFLADIYSSMSNGNDRDSSYGTSIEEYFL